MPWKKKTAKEWKGNKEAVAKVTEKKKGPVNVKGSPQQEAIWKAMTETDGHVVVEALAGTGKTFSMLHGMSLMDSTDVAFMAYNKSIADELTTKVPEGMVACTTHSHGYRALRDAFKYTKKPTGWKTWNIIEEIYGGKEQAAKEDQVKLMAIEKLVGMIKNTLSGEWDNQAGFSISGGDMMELVNRYSIDVNDSQDEIFDASVEVIERSIDLFQKEKAIDFDDMIWLPVILNLRIPKYGNLIIDEAQDLNRSRQELIYRSMDQGGRIMIVGDRNQAIYGFTGADMQSIPNMTKRLNGAEVLPLTVSRRCPKSHVALAKRLVPAFESLPEAIEGQIEMFPQGKLQDSLSGGEMVLCRVNAPLIGGALKCITAGKKAVVQGRDIGKYLKAFMRKFEQERVVDLLTDVEDYADNERAKISRMKDRDRQEQKTMELDDKVAVVHALCEGEVTTEKVMEKVDKLFSDTEQKKEDVTTFSSIHKSKGLESKKVIVMQPEIMNHPMAKTPEDRQQERNVQYVGLTRSQDYLGFAIGPKQEDMTLESILFGKGN